MEIRKLSNYSFGGETHLSFDEATKKVAEALKEQGFGVLTEIDAKRVLRKSWVWIEGHIEFSVLAIHTLPIRQLI